MNIFQPDLHPQSDIIENWFQAGLLVWDLILEHFGVLGRHFGTLLIIIGSKDAFSGVVEGPSNDFLRFVVIFGWLTSATLGSLASHF